MFVIFPIVIYFLNTSTLPQISSQQISADTGKVIYLVKINWHTGIIFRTDQVDTTFWKSLDDFKNYKYVDVGWGDRDFYQHPGFNVDLAARALFIKTKSTLRIGGINNSIEKYIQSTDYAEKLILSDEQYVELCRFMQSTYFLEKGRPQILSEHFDGAVKFYKAKGYYNCFNTCNTWVAKALKFAGYKIDDHLILSEQLFRETVKYGRMVKIPE